MGRCVASSMFAPAWVNIVSPSTVANGAMNIGTFGLKLSTSTNSFSLFSFMLAPGLNDLLTSIYFSN